MIDKGPLDRFIAANTTPIYPSSFDAVREGYKEQHGDKGWIGKLATQMSGSVPDAQSGFKKGTPEYKANHTAYNSARKQIERWNHGTSPKEANADRIAKAGQTLNPIGHKAPAGGLTVTVKFNAPGDRSHAPREREFTITMDATTAQEFASAPDYDFLFESWFEGGAEAYGDDGDYEAENVQVS